MRERRKWSTRTKLLVLAAIWAGIAVVWYLRRERSLDVEARIALEAMMDANGSYLKQIAFEEELESNPELTAEKLSSLYTHLIIPRIRALKKNSNVVLQDNIDQGVASFEIETKFGFRLTMAAEMYRADNRAKCSVLRPLYGAWIMEHFASRDLPFTLLHRNEAVLVGMRKDREALRQAGIKALSDVQIGEGRLIMTNVDDMITRYEAWNKSIVAKGTP